MSQVLKSCPTNQAYLVRRSQVVIYSPANSVRTLITQINSNRNTAAFCQLPFTLMLTLHRWHSKLEYFIFLESFGCFLRIPNMEFESAPHNPLMQTPRQAFHDVVSPENNSLAMVHIQELFLRFWRVLGWTLECFDDSARLLMMLSRAGCTVQPDEQSWTVLV